MKHVEFLGLPGAGKSTLFEYARQSIDAPPDSVVDLEEATFRAVRRQGRDKLARVVARLARSANGRIWRWAFVRSTDRFAALPRYLSHNPRLMEVVLAAQQRRRNPRSELVLSWMLNLLAAFQLAREAGDDGTWLIIDEGFCQRALSLFAYGFAGEDEAALEAYIEAIPLPNVVILVEAPIAVCEERLDGRGWSERITDLDAGDRHTYMVAASTCVELIANLVERRGARLVRVDGSGPVAESRALLAEGLHI